jgi:hypothetical protein
VFHDGVQVGTNARVQIGSLTHPHYYAELEYTPLDGD